MSELVEKPEEYFRKLVPSRSELLMTLEEEALREEIPIVGPVVGELLHILTRVSGAATILELGTATGYSSIFMAGALVHTGGRLISVEKEPQMAARARSNLEKAGLGGCTDVVVGDALQVVAELETGFDMIFLDVDKESYEPALPHCHRLLKPGGLLAADNVAFKDADPFNRKLYSDPGWKPVSLLCFLPLHSPESDGFCLALRL